MTDLGSKIEQTKKIAERLARRDAALADAMKKHDVCLYKLLDNLHELQIPLLKMGPDEAIKALKPRYRDQLPATRKLGLFLLKLVYPTQAPKERWKYAKLLRFAEAKKKPNQSFKNFVRTNGGMKACVAEGRKLSARKRGRISV